MIRRYEYETFRNLSILEPFHHKYILKGLQSTEIGYAPSRRESISLEQERRENLVLEDLDANTDSIDTWRGNFNGTLNFKFLCNY